MCNAGIKNIIRIRTCGALDGTKVGDLVVVDAVIRGDESRRIMDKDFKTVADKHITDTFTKWQKDSGASISRYCMDYGCAFA